MKANKKYKPTVLHRFIKESGITITVERGKSRILVDQRLGRRITDHHSFSHDAEGMRGAMNLANFWFLGKKNEKD